VKEGEDARAGRRVARTASSPHDNVTSPFPGVEMEPALNACGGTSSSDPLGARRPRASRRRSTPRSRSRSREDETAATARSSPSRDMTTRARWEE
jgi:hypothetical protein